MKLNQRLLVHTGAIPTNGVTPTEVTVMEFSPNGEFVKLRPANPVPIEFWIRVGDVKVFTELTSGDEPSTTQYGQKLQSVAAAITLAGILN